MGTSVDQLFDFVSAEFIDPKHKSTQNLDEIITALNTDPLWHSRAQIVKQAVDGELSAADKQRILDTYTDLTKNGDPLLLAEAARAAAVFEEPELLAAYLQRAEQAIGFSPEITGVEVNYRPNQTKPALRMVCLAPSRQFATDPPNSTISLENVPIQATDDRFSNPKFVDPVVERSATAELSNFECVLLLLHAEQVRLENASMTSVSGEQALPYIRRITDSVNFSLLDIDIQKHALLSRSVLEMKDINELERGTVQLMKMGLTLQSVSLTGAFWQYFHQLMPLSWRTVDENAARRLVAMSDFANAVPIYRRLDKKFDLAVSLAAADKTAEALEVLGEINPVDGATLMLMGDLSADPQLWLRAWEEFTVIKAKLRLAQLALSHQDRELALRHLEDLLSKSAADHEALLLAGSVALSLTQWSAAADYLKRALAIKEDDPASWSNLATALIQSNAPEPALHALKQAIRVNQNADPNLLTYTNFVSLSAQLQQWDEAVSGLMKLVGAAEKGSLQYVARLSPIFPRLVQHYVKQPYTGEGMQKFTLQLFTESMAAVLPNDDPVLQRLNAKLYVWSGNYAAGLKCFSDSFDAIVKSGSDFNADPRARARLELYAAEAIEALQLHGDKNGRIEGSLAFPGWKTRVLSIEQTVSRLIKN